MRRCNVVRVLPNQDQHKTLSVAGDRCATLWNAVQYRCRQAFFGREALPSYERLCEEFLGHPAYRALPSDIGQEMIKKARSAWNSFFALRRKHAQGLIQNAPGIPRYWKDRKTGKRLAKCIPVKSPRSYAIDARILTLTLPEDMRRRPGDRLVLSTKGTLRYRGIPKTLELKLEPIRRRWCAHQVVEAQEPHRKTVRPRCAALDLGARTLVALAVEGLSRPILFSGREVWKDFLYWTRQIAREQVRLATEGRKTSRRLKMLYQNRARRMEHAAQALAAGIVRVLKRNRVGVLYMEDLTGIREDMDFGLGNLLVHNFWVFRKLRKAVEAACARRGVATEAKPPRGTSSYCASCCSPIQRFSRHKAYCPHCNRTWHADANAAAYMLRLWSPSNGHGVEAKTPAPVALRWDRHRWVARAKSAVRMRRALSGSLAV